MDKTSMKFCDQTWTHAHCIAFLESEMWFHLDVTSVRRTRRVREQLNSLWQKVWTSRGNIMGDGGREHSTAASSTPMQTAIYSSFCSLFSNTLGYNVTPASETAECGVLKDLDLFHKRKQCVRNWPLFSGWFYFQTLCQILFRFLGRSVLPMCKGARGHQSNTTQKRSLRPSEIYTHIKPAFFSRVLSMCTGMLVADIGRKQIKIAADCTCSISREVG